MGGRADAGHGDGRGRNIFEGATNIDGVDVSPKAFDFPEKGGRGSLRMMNRTFSSSLRFLPLALLPLFSLNSCVMLSVMGAHRETSSQLDLQGGKDHPGTKGKPTEAGPGKHRNPTRKEVVAAWGEPKEKRQEADGGETWIWKRGSTIWTGMLGVVGVVPIPLALPIGREGMEVKFAANDGPMVEWTDIERGQASAGFGMTPDLEGGDYSRRHNGLGFGRNDFEKKWVMETPPVRENWRRTEASR